MNKVDVFFTEVMTHILNNLTPRINAFGECDKSDEKTGIICSPSIGDRVNSLARTKAFRISNAKIDKHYNTSKIRNFFGENKEIDWFDMFAKISESLEEFDEQLYSIYLDRDFVINQISKLKMNEALL